MKIEGNKLVSINAHNDIVKGKFVVPDKVTIIGAYAFHVCRKLVKIDLRNATELEHCAFCCCTNLKEVINLRNVELLGNAVFAWCESLNSEALRIIEIMEDKAMKGIIIE